MIFAGTGYGRRLNKKEYGTFFERAMHNMSVELRKWLYRVMPWLAGVLLTGLAGGTVLVTDGSLPSDLQGTQWMWLSAVMTIALPLWLAGYIVNPQRTVRIVSETVQWVLMGFGAVEALHGLGQIAGIYPSNHSLFVLTGTFYNPGPYSGYLAAVLPIALYRMLVLSGKKDRLSVVQYYLSICVLLLICCVLPAGMSRAAWIASLISCGYVVLRVYHVKVKSFVSEHRYAVLGVLILGLLFASGAYFMKRDSADGRLLIGKITSQAIASSPWGKKTEGLFPPFTVMLRKDTSLIVNIQNRKHGLPEHPILPSTNICR